VVDGLKIKSCRIDGAKIGNVRFNEDASRIAVNDSDGVTWLIGRDNCKAKKIVPNSDDEGSNLTFRYRMGYVMRASSWREEKSKEEWTRVRIWSEEKQDVVLDWKRREE